MAKIVFGVATSHSPQLSTPVDKMHLHAERDQTKKRTHYRGGYYSYDELVEMHKDANLEPQVTEEKWQENFAQWERRIEEVQDKLVAAKPDIAIVIGDDQWELFQDDGMPALSVFWGDKIEVIPKEKLLPSMEPSRWANFGERREAYECHPELGKHIIEKTIAAGFDVGQLTRQAEGRGIGHSFIFTRRRIMKEELQIPIVPVMINTYFPPNQPTVSRCYEFGKAIRQAVESWDSDLRVAVVASGGMSHFVVDEEFDQLILQALKNKDEALLATVKEEYLHEGTSEIRNWIAAAGAVDHLEMEVIDYIPAYRTIAGTGCGMGFAYWK
ncbi:protocatechuate 3,4-dioxygenase [Brevibacillus reuszeri]|uniref:DODA-type extradiol aromatic ring-opening family dioxygenase n=1 Tax=Brevibacillus reuszeri TaxID=54915 RepID=UPI000CCBE661|nr:protocatechuate 3,4-dioxygenase [Brevibacillus reuszeri]